MDIQWNRQTKAKIEKLGATHGAIGGCPGYSQFWSVPVGYDYPHDRRMSILADISMRSSAEAVGVPIRVLSSVEYGFSSSSPTPSRASTIRSLLGSFVIHSGIGFGGF
jgi:hypothetical protein